MIIEDNGTIVGNWKKEKWELLRPGAEQLVVSGKGITLSFRRFTELACGVYARVPGKGHSHDVEQLTVMLEGSATAILNGKRFPVRKGSHWLAPAGVDHALDLRESSGGVTILQIFPGADRPPLP